MSDSTVWFLVFWFILGLVGMGINSAKGKDVVWGFIGGVVFGFFGLIFLAIHDSPGIPCNTCKERVKTGAIICKHCGTHFAVPAGSAG